MSSVVAINNSTTQPPLYHRTTLSKSSSTESKDSSQDDSSREILCCTTVHKTRPQRSSTGELQETIAKLNRENSLSFMTMRTRQPPTVLPARNGEVMLIRSSSFPMSQFGVATLSRSYTIKVAGISHSKTVVLRGKDHQGRYMELLASFGWKMGDNSEIWQAYRNEPDDGFESFSISLVTDDIEYVDDNDSNMFRDDNVIGVQLYHGVHVRRWTAGPLLHRHPTTLEVGAHVRNLSFRKTVEVWFTTDNWETKQIAPLAFQERERYGAGYITSPNNAGVEYWSAVINVGENVSSVKYAIRFSCDQGEYWDNNWGENYEANRVLQSTP